MTDYNDGQGLRGGVHLSLGWFREPACTIVFCSLNYNSKKSRIALLAVDAKSRRATHGLGRRTRVLAQNAWIRWTDSNLIDMQVGRVGQHHVT